MSKKDKPIVDEIHGNTKLWNQKPINDVYKDGQKVATTHQVIVDVIGEDAFKSLINDKVKKALETVGFKSMGIVTFEPGVKTRLVLDLRMKKGTDSPGQTKMFDGPGHDGEGDPEDETEE